MMITRLRFALFLAFGFAVVLLPELALAQDTRGANKMITSTAENIGGFPRLIALMSYIVGVFFAASGLLKLKDWINEGDKAGIKPALFRLFLAPFFILLPHAIIVINSALFSRNEGGADVGDSPEGMVHRVDMNAFGKRQ